MSLAECSVDRTATGVGPGLSRYFRSDKGNDLWQTKFQEKLEDVDLCNPLHYPVAVSHLPISLAPHGASHSTSSPLVLKIVPSGELTRGSNTLRLNVNATNGSTCQQLTSNARKLAKKRAITNAEDVFASYKPYLRCVPDNLFATSCSFKVSAQQLLIPHKPVRRMKRVFFAFLLQFA